MPTWVASGVGGELEEIRQTLDWPLIINSSGCSRDRESSLLTADAIRQSASSPFPPWLTADELCGSRRPLSLTTGKNSRRRRRAWVTVRVAFRSWDSQRSCVGVRGTARARRPDRRGKFFEFFSRFVAAQSPTTHRQCVRRPRGGLTLDSPRHFTFTSPTPLGEAQQLEGVRDDEHARRQHRRTSSRTRRSTLRPTHLARAQETSRVRDWIRPPTASPPSRHHNPSMPPPASSRPGGPQRPFLPDPPVPSSVPHLQARRPLLAAARRRRRARRVAARAPPAVARCRLPLAAALEASRRAAAATARRRPPTSYGGRRIAQGKAPVAGAAEGDGRRHRGAAGRRCQGGAG